MFPLPPHLLCLALPAEETALETAGLLLKLWEGYLSPWLECKVIGLLYLAAWAHPFSIGHVCQRGRETEHVIAFVTGVTEDDLLLMMASIAQLTHERLNVLGDTRQRLEGETCSLHIPLAVLAVLAARGW